MDEQVELKIHSTIEWRIDFSPRKETKNYSRFFLTQLPTFKAVRRK